MSVLNLQYLFASIFDLFNLSQNNTLNFIHNSLNIKLTILLSTKISFGHFIPWPESPISCKASAIAIWVPWTKAKVWVVVGLPPQVNSANKTIWLSNRHKCHPSRATRIRRKEEDSSHRLMLALGSKISSQILTRLALSNLLLNQAHQTYSVAALSIWISWVDSQCRIITLVISPSPNPHSTAWPPREVLAKVEWIWMHLENKIKVVHPEAQTGATKKTSNKRATPSMALSNSEQKYKKWYHVCGLLTVQ